MVYNFIKILIVKNDFKRRKKLEKKYAVLLDDFSYEDDGSNNDAAKSALKAFYENFSNEQPNRRYSERFSHMLYLINLVPIYKALKENKLSQACHELRTILHYQDFLQPRIQMNILFLLKKQILMGDINDVSKQKSNYQRTYDKLKKT